MVETSNRIRSISVSFSSAHGYNALRKAIDLNRSDEDPNNYRFRFTFSDHSTEESVVKHHFLRGIYRKRSDEDERLFGTKRCVISSVS